MNFEYRPYVLQFERPLYTRYGLLNKRCGIIIQLSNEIGQCAYGDIACFPELGSESFEEALTFCKDQKGVFLEENLEDISQELSCCQFAFESAFDSLPLSTGLNVDLQVVGLLSSGPDVLTQAVPLLEKGYKVIKWKIGVFSAKQEQQTFKQLAALSQKYNTRWRLDANGALTKGEYVSWMRFLEDYEVEFLEQPLPVGEERAMLERSLDFKTMIAFDESASSLGAIQQAVDLGFEGIFVIKPSIFGFMKAFQAWCIRNPIKRIYSSVFETSVGIQALLKLAAKDTKALPGLGLGTLNFLNQGPLSYHRPGPTIHCASSLENETVLWNCLA